MRKSVVNVRHLIDDDSVFQQGLLRFQRVLAKLLAVAMVLVIIAATVQLLMVIAVELLPSSFPFLVTELEVVLGQVLELLIAIEVLENITAYLKDHSIQVRLVLATAITALARKIIVLPGEMHNKPMLIASLGVACLSLCAAYWLVSRSKLRMRSSSR